jgi:hypothetical protein
LIAYEDTTSGNHTFNYRDSMQASNLVNAITAKGDTGKTIVLAGYSHIYKQADNTGNTFMAQYFMRKSGITPFCIETVNANKADRAAIAYQAPCLLLKEGVYRNDAPGRYDMQVYYPGRYFIASNAGAMYQLTCKKVALPSVAGAMAVIYLYDEYHKTSPVNELIPVRVCWPLTGVPAKAVYLPDGRYTICVYDLQGKLLSEQDVRVH